MLRSFAAALVLLLALSPQGIAQDATPRALQDIHVSVEAGADGNSGAAEAPLASLGEGLRRALENRGRGRGSRVLLHPGTYREAIEGYFDSRGAPIVIQALQPGKAIVSGSDVWNGWSCAATCTHAWPYTWGEAPNPWPEASITPPGLRREMVFVDGRPLGQRLSRAELLREPGTFLVDEPRAEIHVNPPAGADLTRALVEVAVRPLLFRAQKLHDLTLDGIVFQHAASPIGEAAVVIVDEDDVAIRNVTVQHNNWDGLSLSSGSRISVRGSVMNRNGGSGIGAYRTTALLLDGNETSFNNWRGAMGGLDGWAVGQKFLLQRGLTIRRHTSVGNASHGLWLDWDNRDVLIEDVRLCGNRRSGLFLELSPGPITVRDGLFCDNGESGIMTSALHRFTLEGNAISGNRHSGIDISGDYGVTITDRVTSVPYTLRNEDWRWRRNAIVAGDGAMLVTTTLPRREWDHLMRSADLDEAHYAAAAARPFQGPGGRSFDLRGWRAATGQDRNSRQDPARLP
jgi:hypothetical protein